MDCSSIESERILKVLDYLSPTVLRTDVEGDTLELNCFKDVYPPSEIRLKDYPEQFRQSLPTKHQYGDEVTTSILFKAPAKVKSVDINSNSINKHLPNLSFTPPNAATDKPLIEITVIPKNTPNSSLTKTKRKRKPFSKRICNTRSNHERASKNYVYLVVANRKRQKVYEIKTTNSVSYNRNYDDDVSLKRLSNLNHLLDSLNMNKRSKSKNRRSTGKRSDNILHNDNKKKKKALHECMCSDEIQNEMNLINVEGIRSRIRLTSHIGRTADDQYVVKYAATVDSDPANTSWNADRVISPSLLVHNNDRRDCKIHDDRNAHTERGIFNRLPSQESQGTQVDFDVGLRDNNKQIVTECRCQSIDKSIDAKLNENNLNRSKSPLVVISVYQNNSDEKVLFKTGDRNPSPQSTKTGPISKTTPSPKSNTDQRKNNIATRRPLTANRKDNNIPTRRTVTPNRMIVQRAKNNTTETKDYAKGTGNPKQPIRNYDRKPGRNIPNHDRKNSFKACTGFKNDRANRLVSTGTNTDHSLTKKALIDTYTKKIIDEMDKKSPPLYRKSPVIDKTTMNMRGDNERYKGDLTADFTMRWTSRDKKQSGKESPSGKYNSSGYNKNDYDNLDCNYLESPMSKLNLRDSLEIFHRRVDHSNRNSDAMNNNENIKHYRGDKCPVMDPIRRDREIKEQLGIGKPRKSPQILYENQRNKLFQYYFGKQCGDNKMTKYHNEQSNVSFDGTISESDSHIYRNKNTIDSCSINEIFFNPVNEFSSDRIYCKSNSVNKMNNKYPANYSTIANCESTEELYGNDFRNANHKTRTPPKEYHKRNHIRDEKFIEQSLLFYQLLNGRIKVFLQVEPLLERQKPIILSLTQYNRVKRAIETTITKRINQRKPCVYKYNSFLSVGHFGKKEKHNKPKHDNKMIQAEVKNEYTIQTQVRTQYAQEKSYRNEMRTKNKLYDESNQDRNTTVFISTEILTKKATKTSIRKDGTVGETVASVTYLKRNAFSSTNVPIGSSCISRHSMSLRTIFTGRRKTPTPNFGTSACSLFSDRERDHHGSVFMPPIVQPNECKAKKPFLRKLFSCLVLQSTKTSDAILKPAPVPRFTGGYSSVDSYHFSTSLGAIEMTSSVFDTSISFYSDHSIKPCQPAPINPNVNEKRKGILSSMRGFLSTRKTTDCNK